ncbi:uncharacterized protein LOC124795787 [Schistocerca piceifrons]|uniref:uncharacterized protein LOC124795787 n=1 Tax=Schistocerca piceifrons TaxID=274613 RepID=UPI001F5E6FCA|nr:uncharacterized protein LOC124795787 [Schistocerca piceifrons]
MPKLSRLTGTINSPFRLLICAYTSASTTHNTSQGTSTSIVKNFKPSVSVDYNDMSCNLLKDVIDCVIYPLTSCVNKCLVASKFLDITKISREQLSMSKFVYLGKLNIISDKQFGFRKGKSTTDAMDSLVKIVLDVFEARGFAQATFCDLSRAFDCVEHHTMLNELVYYSFDDNSINMFRSFLDICQQVVCIGREKSNLVIVRMFLHKALI